MTGGGCLAYIAVSGGEALLLDPLRAFADRYPDGIDQAGAAVEAVVDSHIHADYFIGLRTVVTATDASPTSPGYYTATLGELRNRLAVFSESHRAFVDRVLESMGARPANFEHNIALNLAQESVSEEKAFELELGPNNCAVADH